MEETDQMGRVMPLDAMGLNEGETNGQRAKKRIRRMYKSTEARCGYLRISTSEHID